MSHGKFNPVNLPTRGKVTVTGPFDPQDRKVDDAKILFLVVQGGGKNTVVIQGEGEWNRGSSNWIGEIKRTGVPALGGTNGTLQHNQIARGIAVSIVVKPGKIQGNNFDPPSIEALTWCSDFMIN